MNRKLLGFFAMLALAAGCLSTTPAESDNEAELDNEDCPDVEPELDPQFDCTDASTADPNATPWFKEHYDRTWRLDPLVLTGHIPQGLATWKNYNNSGRNLLVYTAYSQFGGHALIQGINEDGERTNYAVIRKGHAGGVAIIGQWAFVSGSNGIGPNTASVYRYQLHKLAGVFAGHPSDALALPSRRSSAETLQDRSRDRTVAVLARPKLHDGSALL